MKLPIIYEARSYLYTIINFNLHQKQLTRMKNNSNKKKPTLARSEPTLNLISAPIELPDPHSYYSNFLEVPNASNLLPTQRRSFQQRYNDIPLLSEEFTDDYVSIPLPSHYYRFTSGGNELLNMKN